MELAQFGNHHFSGDFEITECLFGSIKHEEAAADVVEGSYRIDRFDS